MLAFTAVVTADPSSPTTYPAQTFRRGQGDDKAFLAHVDGRCSWTSPCGSPTKLYLLERNRWAMLLAYLRWPSLLALSPALLVTEVLMWGFCLWRGWPFIRAKIASYRWVVEHWGRSRSGGGWPNPCG